MDEKRKELPVNFALANNDGWSVKPEIKMAKVLEAEQKPADKLTGKEVADGVAGGIFVALLALGALLLKLLLFPFCIMFAMLILLLNFITKHYIIVGCIIIGIIILAALKS